MLIRSIKPTSKPPWFRWVRENHKRSHALYSPFSIQICPDRVPEFSIPSILSRAVRPFRWSLALSYLRSKLPCLFAGITGPFFDHKNIRSLDPPARTQTVRHRVNIFLSFDIPHVQLPIPKLNWLNRSKVRNIYLGSFQIVHSNFIPTLLIGFILKIF